MSVANIKQQLHELAERLPDTATWRDVLYEAHVRQEVETGLEEARRGEFASDEDIKDTFAKWGVTVETEVDSPRAPPVR